MKYILIAVILAFSTASFGQLTEEKLKDIITEKLLRWETVLGLSQTKSDNLEKIFEDQEQAMYTMINNPQGNVSERLKEIDAQTDVKIKQLFTAREYEMYSTISEQEKMSQYDYLTEIIGGYAEDEELTKEIYDYQMANILPRLRVARLALEAYIHPEDTEIIEELRTGLYQTLDECLILCSIKPDSTQNETILLNQLLSNAISEQLDDESSSLNTLFKMTKRYEEAIHKVYETLEEDNKKWTTDLAAIQKNHIMPTHIESFKELTNVASYISLEHMKKDAFFLLSDGNSTQSLMKVLRIGNHFMPYVGL